MRSERVPFVSWEREGLHLSVIKRPLLRSQGVRLFEESKQNEDQKTFRKEDKGKRSDSEQALEIQDSNKICGKFGIDGIYHSINNVK